MPTPTPSPTPAPSPSNSSSPAVKKTKIDTSSPFKLSGGTNRLNTASPFSKPRVKSAETSLWNNLLSFGGSVINTVETPLYWVAGWNEAANKNEEARKAAIAKKYPAPKGETAMQRQQRELDIANDPELKDFQGPVDQWAAAAENATNWTRGKESKTTGSLATDILLDPTTYVPGGIIIKPLKALSVGTKTAVTATKLAKLGQVSMRVAFSEAGRKAEMEAIKKSAKAQKVAINAAKRQVIIDSSPLKPGTSILNQYKNKPIIRGNLKSATGADAAKLDKIQRTIYKNFQYRTSPISPFENNAYAIIASGLEAGYKAAASTFLQEYGRMSIETGLRRAAATAERLAPASVKAIDNAGQAMELEQFVPHALENGSVLVRDANGDTWQFGSMQKANKFIKKETGSVATAKTTGAAQFLDSAPVTPAAIAKTVAKTPVAKDAKKTLETMNKLAASATGISRAADIAPRLTEILNRVDAGRLAPTTQAALKQIAENGADPLRYILTLVGKGSTAEEKQLGRLLANRTFKTADGQIRKIGEIALRSAEPGGRQWADLLPSTREQILAHFKGLTGGTEGSIRGKQAALVALVGKDLAARIAKTGVLDPSQVTDEKALAAIYKELPTEVQKQYTDFNDLLNGLKAGDVGIDLNLLHKLARVIDPETATINQIEKAAGAGTAYQQLTDILVSKGPQTLADTADRVAKADATTFMKGAGLGNADAIGVTVEGRLNGTIPAQPSALIMSRQKAGVDLAEALKAPDTSAITKDALDAINKGIGGEFDYMEQEIAKGVATPRLTTLNDTALVIEGGGKAIITSEIAQYVDARIAANAVGKARYRESFQKVGKLTEKILPNTDKILNRLIQMMDTVDTAMLAVNGTRIVAKKTAAAAKKTGNHYVYTSTSAFLNVFNKTNRDLLKRAIIPDVAKGFEPTDGLDFVSITNAIRHVLEAEEKGTTISIDEVASILRKKGESKFTWSKKFQNQSTALTLEVAAHLTDPAIVKEFRDIHMARTIATIEDGLPTATRLADDLMHTMLQGHLINKNNGIDSTAARAQLARDWFQNYIYLSGALNQIDSETTKSVFQAAALMFMPGGRISKSIGDNVSAPSLIGGERAATEEDRATWAEITDAINGMFKHQNADANPRMTPARDFFPTQEKIDKVTRELTGAKTVFENHINTRPVFNNLEEATAWKKTFDKFHAKLIKTRTAAEELNIPTFYWHNGEWVPRARYNHDLAVQAAKENPENFITTAEGLMRAAVTDVPPKLIDGKKLTAAETKKMMAQWTEENAKRSVTAMEGVHEEAAQFAIKNIDELDQYGVDETQKGIRMFQELYARVYDDAQIKVFSGRTTYDWKRGPLGVNEFRTGMLGRIGSALNANTERWETRPVLNRAESTVHTDVMNLTDALRGIRNKYLSNKQLKAEGQFIDLAGRKGKANVRALTAPEFQEAFDIALSAARPRRGTSQYVAELAADLRSIIDPIFGAADNNEIVKAGITPQAFTKALQRHGLTEQLGFQLPGHEADPLDLANYASWLPFAKMPAAFKGTHREQMWLERAQKFKDSGEDPFVTLVRLCHAVQFAKTEHTFVTDFVTRFSHKALGMTETQALRNGFVKIAGISGGTGVDLTQYIPEKTYFPVDIAKEFLSLNREWNKIFNDPVAQNEVNRAIMDIMGAIKSTQTVMMPRHHITNAVGDTTTALIAGVNNPYHWGVGFGMAAKYIGKDLAATFGAAKVEQKIMRAVQGIKSPSKSIEIADKYGAKNPGIAITKNGKTTQIPITMDEWYRLFLERNVLTHGLVQNDTPGLIDSVLNEKALKGAQATAYDKITEHLRRGSAAVSRPFGTFAAYYGNAIRAAHAFKIIQERAWGSVDEALDAVNEGINRYHPTIQSLAAGERKYPRMMFSYYTWIRVAHNAFIDMLMNHTGAMLIPSKIQYQQAQDAGFNPESIGSPWENKGSYLKGQSYSVYGPTENGPQGPALYKRSILPLDVLDTWSFVNDAMLTDEQNQIYNSQQFFRTLIKNSNEVIKPIGEFALGQNLDTGAPDRVESWAQLGDKYVQQFGFMQILQGMGNTWADPYNRRAENTEKPTTQAERDLKLFNSLTGQKKQYLKTPRTIPVAQREARARIKQYIENLTKGNK